MRSLKEDLLTYFSENQINAYNFSLRFRIRQQTLYHILNGTVANPKKKTIRRLCQIMGIKCDLEEYGYKKTLDIEPEKD